MTPLSTTWRLLSQTGETHAGTSSSIKHTIEELYNMPSLTVSHNVFVCLYFQYCSNMMMCFLLMTLVLVLILNPLLDFFFLYIKLMCPYFILLIYTDGERDGLWMACPFRTLVVLYRMFPFIICLILMNYLMEFYFIGFVIAHLPGCFCPWTFRLNIGLNTSPSDSFVSYLNSHLGYSAGEFQALQLIVLAVFGAGD